MERKPSRTQAEGALRKRIVNLRRSKQTKLTNLQPGDVVTTVFDAEKWEWRQIVESSNGVRIEHVRLTSGPPPS